MTRTALLGPKLSFPHHCLLARASQKHIANVDLGLPACSGWSPGRQFCEMFYPLVQVMSLHDAMQVGLSLLVTSLCSFTVHGNIFHWPPACPLATTAGFQHPEGKFGHCADPAAPSTPSMFPLMRLLEGVFGDILQSHIIVTKG